MFLPCFCHIHQFSSPNGDFWCVGGLGASSPSTRQVFRVLLKRWSPQQIRSLRLQFGDLHLVCHARLSQVGWLSHGYHQLIT